MFQLHSITNLICPSHVLHRSTIVSGTRWQLAYRHLLLLIVYVHINTYNINYNYVSVVFMYI